MCVKTKYSVTFDQKRYLLALVCISSFSFAYPLVRLLDQKHAYFLNQLHDDDRYDDAYPNNFIVETLVAVNHSDCPQTACPYRRRQGGIP